MRFVLWLALAATSAACVTVAPYHRGRLQQRTMRSKPALDRGFDVHVMDLRESAIGATGGEGASCGCR